MQRPYHRKLFGEAIRKYRNKAELTQEELAERADMHRNSIREVERGNMECSLTSMQKIAKGLVPGCVIWGLIIEHGDGQR